MPPATDRQGTLPLKRQPEGFTFVELAIVMIIVGVVIALGAVLIGPLMRWVKARETTETVNAAVEEVATFAAFKKRLPTTAEFPNAVRTPSDAWTRQLFYFQDSGLTSIVAPLTDALCGKTATALTVCLDAACIPATNIKNTAYVVGSGADNNNSQTGTFTGAPCPSGQTCVRAYPLDTPNIDDNASDFTRPEFYDDIVKWVTLEELKTKIGCSGNLRIITDKLPFGYRGNPYTALVMAEGGAPYASGKYKWCVQTLSGALPGGIIVAPNVVSADCAGLAEASWGASSDTLQVSGSPANEGSYNLTFFARDNNDPAGPNDNTSVRQLVMTVNPNTSVSVAPPPGAQITFEDNLDQLGENIVENDPNAVVVDTANNTISFGWLLSDTRGCIWFPNNQTLLGKTMRAYYEFQFQSVDVSADSTVYADGYTFTLMQGSNDTTVCGTSGSPGGGPFGEYLGYDGLAGRSLAVEFDVYPNAGQNDPAGNYNHVAVDRDGSVSHGNAAVGNPPCNGTNTGCVYDNAFGNNYPVTWLEEGTLHNARVEVLTQCDNVCGNCGVAGNTYSYIKVWVDCAGCNNLTVNYSATSPKVSHCFVLDSAMNTVKFGFTEATGASVQHVTIYNFGIGFY